MSSSNLLGEKWPDNENVYRAALRMLGARAKLRLMQSQISEIFYA